MKTKLQLALFVLMISLFTLSIPQSVEAQTPANHLFHVITWNMATGMDSTARADRDAILKEYHNKVTMKNEYILHSTSMVHYYTEDSREYVTIYEYATWNDIDKAGDRDGELEKQAWPDQKQREAFMKKMSSYFTSHKDAIYHGQPALTK